MARAQRPPRTYRAHYSSLCITCGGIIEPGATIFLNVPGKTGKGHADCEIAPRFDKTHEQGGLALYEFNEAKSRTTAKSRLYFVRALKHGGVRVDVVTGNDLFLVTAIKLGTVRSPEPGEASARANWAQFCRVCDGVIDFNEPLYYRKRDEPGPKQRARHLVQCSPTEWRVTKNAAGTWFEDLRPDKGGALWHLPKRGKTGVVKQPPGTTVEGGTLSVIDRDTDRKLVRATFESHERLAETNRAVKFVGETVAEFRDPAKPETDPLDEHRPQGL